MTKRSYLTQEIHIAQKSFCTQFAREKHGFLGFLFMLSPKIVRKGIKNEKKCKKLSVFFFIRNSKPKTLITRLWEKS